MQYCEKAVQLKPEMEEAYRALAEIYRRTGHADKALLLYEKIVMLSGKRAYLFTEIGNLYNEIDALEYAEKSFSIALKMNPNNGYVHYEMGRIYQYKEKNIDKAIEMYELAIKNTKYLPDPYTNMGTIYFEKKDLKKALSYFKKASELGDRKAKRKLAVVYKKLGNHAEELEVIRQ